MALTEIDLPLAKTELPETVASLISEAERRIDQFVDERSVLPTGFVPCNFETVYRALAAIEERSLACGNSLCEWGSGFGVVATLATTLGFNACGIEIDEELVEEAQKLADDFDLPVEFVQGSFIPEEAQLAVESGYLDHIGQPSWLVTHAEAAYDELGLEPDDFDLIFAYPWPGEESVIDVLFDRVAGVGTLLLTFDQYNSIRLKRKIAARRRR